MLPSTKAPGGSSDGFVIRPVPHASPPGPSDHDRLTLITQAQSETQAAVVPAEGSAYEQTVNLTPGVTETLLAKARPGSGEDPAIKKHTQK